MIYVIYVGKSLWTCCETYTQVIREVNKLKCHHAGLLKSYKIKVLTFKEHADITSQVKELLNS